MARESATHTNVLSSESYFVKAFIGIFFVGSVFCSCTGSLQLDSQLFSSNNLAKKLDYKSGTIVISHTVPSATYDDTGSSTSIALNYNNQKTQPQTTRTQISAPLIGYFPPSDKFLPADNEAWLEIDSTKNIVTLYRGSATLTSSEVLNPINLKSPNIPKVFYLQNKLSSPLWYANESYFTRRNLSVPPEKDSSRYLRGALGDYSLYISGDLPIHCSLAWTEEVGGIRLSKSFVAQIYETLPVGASVIFR